MQALWERGQERIILCAWHDNLFGGLRLRPCVQLSYDTARMRLGQQQILLFGAPNLDMTCLNAGQRDVQVIDGETTELTLKMVPANLKIPAVSLAISLSIKDSFRELEAL